MARARSTCLRVFDAVRSVRVEVFTFHVSEKVDDVTRRFQRASPSLSLTSLCPTVKKVTLLLILGIALCGLRTFRL